MSQKRRFYVAGEGNDAGRLMLEITSADATALTKPTVFAARAKVEDLRNPENKEAFKAWVKSAQESGMRFEQAPQLVRDHLRELEKQHDEKMRAQRDREAAERKARREAEKKAAAEQEAAAKAEAERVERERKARQERATESGADDTNAE